MGDTRAHVTGEVHREPGGTTHAHTDGPNEQPDADIDAGRRLGRHDRQDAGDENEGREEFDEEVTRQIADARGGGEDVADGDRVDHPVRRIEVILVHDVHDDRPEDPAEHVGQRIRDEQRPRNVA